MKYVVRMSEEQRQFIVALLSETKDDFVRAFRDLAKSGSIKGKRKFASDWISLAELVFAKAEDYVKAEEDDEVGNDFYFMSNSEIANTAIRLARRNKWEATKFFEGYAMFLQGKCCFKNLSEAKSTALKNLRYMASLMSKDSLKLICDTYEPLLDEEGGSQC